MTARYSIYEGLQGPGCFRWFDIRDSEDELSEFYKKCERYAPWTPGQRFKIWFFRKQPKVVDCEYEWVHLVEKE